LGPVIGGWITDTLNWRWLFYINLVPGLLVAVSIPFLVKIDKPNFSLFKAADYPGIILMAIGLGCLQYVLEEGARWNWFDDATIRVCSILAMTAGILFVVRSLTFARPVVDLRALGNRNFLVGCILSFMTGVGIFAPIFLTPLFLGYVRGFSAWQIGVALSSTGAASLVGVPVYILLARKFDTRWVMMFGLTLFGLSMWSFSFITHDWGAAQLLVPQILRGFPQVFAVAPAVTLGLGSLPADRLKYASGLFNMMRNLGGAIGIAVCATLLNNRTNLHFLRLAERLNSTNAAVQGMLHQVGTKFAAANGGDLLHGQASALKQLWSLTYREARVQTFADAFLVVGACLAFATLLAPLLRKISAPLPPSADAH
jgi:MFS transporter, DHA2 family, multidrug resistance protein